MYSITLLFVFSKRLKKHNWVSFNMVHLSISVALLQVPMDGG
jgi:hypothetical protein